MSKVQQTKKTGLWSELVIVAVFMGVLAYFDFAWLWPAIVYGLIWACIGIWSFWITIKKKNIRTKYKKWFGRN